MESSVSTSDALVRPWRTATIVASFVAAVELVVLLVIGLAVLGGPLLDWTQGRTQGSTEPQAAAVSKERKTAVVAVAPAPVAQAVEAPKLARTETSVLVLNGNGIAGAAAAEAELVRHKGYVLAATGNATRSDYVRSIVMYRPGYQAEATRLARDVRITIVSPLDGLRLNDLMGAHAAVVIGSK